MSSEHVANNRLSRKQIQLTESSCALSTCDTIRRVMGSNRKTLFLSHAAPRSFLKTNKFLIELVALQGKINNVAMTQKH